jgi:hypothetical protein
VMLLVSRPFGVATITGPEVARSGTEVTTEVADVILNVAAVPLKLAPVSPVGSVPRIVVRTAYSFTVLNTAPRR